MAWLACRPAVASCGLRLRPPELRLSCRAGRPAAADRSAAAGPAPSQRTADISSAPHCPERHTGSTFSWVCYSQQQATKGEVSVTPVNAFC